MYVWIQGASRGIGLALTAQLLEREATVFASSRSGESAGLTALGDRFGERLQPLALDLNDEASIAAAARAIGERADRLHLVLNVAGVLHDGELQPEKRLEHVARDRLLASFAVNSVGPMLVIKHALPLIPRAERAVIANLSARVGSIGDNRIGGWYGYRAAKAAQNMLTKTLSIELKRRRPEAICLALHPGTVETDLSAPFRGNVPADKLFSPARAARQLLEIIDGATVEDTGRFFAWDGQPIQW